MPQYPMMISQLENTDKAFYEAVRQVYDLAMAPGALDVKTKILIAMALDAHAHAGEGVKTLAAAARGQGATDEQISEALRIAYMVSGMGTLAASGAAFRS